MPRTVGVRWSVPVDASAETVWSVATDWRAQREWMLGTEVWIVDGDGGLGSELAAFTGLCSIGFLDTMRIVELDAPHRCRVEHTGAVVRGEGGFEVVRSGPRSATFLWWESLLVPTPAAWGWPVAKPGFLWGLRRSLDAFAQRCREQEDGDGGRE